ncbi:MAG: class I SAM-dependent methyltransferase [Acidobacteria bacterium]|nr:MAG: class I SAM-dependent methyltransferase [Acidobacteriota bacterium]
MRQGSLIEPQELIDRLGVEGLCRTADEYFHGFGADEQSNFKPFGTLDDAPRCLLHLGQVLGALQLGVGMTVVDSGAGTAWLTRALAQIGVEAIAVDPSARALELGEKLAAEDVRRPLWVAPRFVVFDGHRIALDDQSVDRVVSFDAFHHVPNPGEVLAEMYRVLRPGGLVALSEPGALHAYTAASQSEMRRYDVLENNIDPDELARLAHRAGFTAVWSMPLLDQPPMLNPRRRRGLVGGLPSLEVLVRLFRQLRASMRNRSITLLCKGEPAIDSRRPEGLEYRVRRRELAGQAVVGEDAAFVLEIENSGEAIWRASGPRDLGVVRLGGRLVSGPEDGVEGAWGVDLPRVGLERDLRPGEVCELLLPLRFRRTGTYELELDLVSEQVTWFRHRSSEPVPVRIEVVGR